MLQQKKWTGWFFLTLVAVLFFPRWYRLSYTKLWELKQMVGKEREVQMQILHPADQMGQLIALRVYLQQGYFNEWVSVYLPDQRTLALSQNPALVRGVLESDHYSLQVKPLSAFTQEEESCVYLGEATTEAKLIPESCIFWRGR
jgi:hypothetical protein